MRRLAVLGLLALVPACTTQAPQAQGPTVTSASPHRGVVADGSFQFTVHSVRCGVSSVGPADLGGKAQGQFCLVRLTVKNVKNSPQTFSGSDQFLFDSSGRKFGDDATAELLLPHNHALLVDINPGNQVNGTVVFDIPKGIRPTSLELHDSPFSAGVTVSLP